MAHQYVKSKRSKHKAIMANTFLDKNTGAFEQINESLVSKNTLSLHKGPERR